MNEKEQNKKEQVKRVGSEYDLDEREYQRCLALAEAATFVDVEESTKPKSIFAFAQPGAGKTALKGYIINEAQKNGNFANFVEFNPDEISTHHRFYPEIINEYPDDSYHILQRFTRRALDTYLRQKAVEISCNLVQEGTLRSPDYIDILDFQKNGGNAEIGKMGKDQRRQSKKVRGGYEIEIDILAVNRFESLLSCFEREMRYEEKGLPPRAVTIENHDASYEKMLENISVIENRKLFDKIQVFKRGYVEEKPELIYRDGDRRFASVAEAIRYERTRQQRELFSEPSDYFRRINELRIKAGRLGNESLLRRLDELEAMFKKEIQNYRRAKSLNIKEEKNVFL